MGCQQVNSLTAEPEGKPQAWQRFKTDSFFLWVGLLSWKSKGQNPELWPAGPALLLALCPLRGLQETRVATREESGVLGFPSRRAATREESGVLGFPSRRGLTPRGSLECPSRSSQHTKLSSLYYKADFH